MLNFDMVGRLRDDKLMVYGTATATELPAIVNAASTTTPFRLNAVGDGEGPSDHASFYRKGIPVLHFFTDVHNDYHTHTDDVDKIDVAGMQRVVGYAERITRAIADRPGRLTFVRAPATATRTGAGPRSGGPQPSMGTVPDMGASDVPGLRLGGVSPGSAAEKAGLKAGDVVVEFDGAPVTDLQSYSDALYSHKPGDEVTVVVMRAGTRHTFKVTLSRRGG
jgi:membrane-associated protease RseP (regulator of RpoE activity)